MHRRDFLLKSGALGLALAMGAGSCAPANNLYRGSATSAGSRRLPRVRISPDRVVKETVGLRPYRLLGPRLDVEMLGNKTIVHNYGHGGSGFSLSWGTGQIAANNAAATGKKEIAVIGCGIVGLTTARLLQEQGKTVTIYDKELWPKVTSSMATGTWSPAHLLCEDEHVTPEFKALWEQACTYSFRTYQNLLGLGDIVTWIDHFIIGGRTHKEEPKLHIKGQLPEPIELTRREHPFRAKEVVNQPNMVFNIPAYLRLLTDDFLKFGGKIQVQEFKTLEEVDALWEDCVVNCTGLGAKTLFNDQNLMPISGQLSFLIPQPEINYRLSTPNGYIIPRKDGLVLGGNAIRNNWNTTPNPEQTKIVIAALNDAMMGMRS
ncbi:FAD-dependent oxidoreductase [Adhaeribacter pallidiroseus]|uniref:D-amino-acid oxidase n=1 Tax=Adhaeribacter pallidiroseus TaxID=2072847 RepID=A0A369QPW3_9BACT|nr:FAD-dependent oxidoreductase [Adhaeribacter pallidiroseus]RDC65326.1 D-amino-acid oxidase [Adhaeribacter pallidiroseus]